MATNPQNEPHPHETVGMDQLPAQSLQPFLAHPFGLLCFGLRPFFTLMFLPHLFLHLRQEFLLESVSHYNALPLTDSEDLAK